MQSRCRRGNAPRLIYRRGRRGDGYGRGAHLCGAAGTPLAYTNMVDGALVMDFYDADFAADFAVSGSALVQSAAVDPGDGCTRVTLTFTQPVWGHTVEYADGTTQVILKKQPVRSDVFGKPLTGVAVLLDAGHGDHDPGAMGAAGAGRPRKKTSIWL